MWNIWISLTILKRTLSENAVVKVVRTVNKLWVIDNKLITSYIICCGIKLINRSIVILINILFHNITWHISAGQKMWNFVWVHLKIMHALKQNSLFSIINLLNMIYKSVNKSYLLAKRYVQKHTHIARLKY